MVRRQFEVRVVARRGQQALAEETCAARRIGAERVAVIDFDSEKARFMRIVGHTTAREELLREMAEAGYDVAEEFDFIDRQSFVIFRPEP